MKIMVGRFSFVWPQARFFLNYTRHSRQTGSVLIFLRNAIRFCKIVERLSLSRFPSGTGAVTTGRNIPVPPDKQRQPEQRAGIGMGDGESNCAPGLFCRIPDVGKQGFFRVCIAISPGK